MKVNLKLLHTFLLVADHNSFRRAAEESNRSQSAVSMQIRQLELQLGVSLFNRTTRRVELTREGELLLGGARKAVLELEAGLQQIRQAANLQRGRLALACAPTVASTRLPQALSRFHEAYPRVSVHVREQASAEILESIRKQEVDFGIGARIPNVTDFHFEPFLSDEFYALVPSDMEHVRRDSVTLEELSHMPALVVTGSAATTASLEEAQKAAGVTLNRKYEVSQVQTQVAMAAAGLGVAILPKIALPPLPDPRFRALPIVDPPLVHELCVITLRGQALPPVAARFVEMLEELLVRPEETPAEPPQRARRISRGHLSLAASKHG